MPSPHILLSLAQSHLEIAAAEKKLTDLRYARSQIEREVRGTLPAHTVVLGPQAVTLERKTNGAPITYTVSKAVSV